MKMRSSAASACGRNSEAREERARNYKDRESG
jgi:hypothetical protein